MFQIISVENIFKEHNFLSPGKIMLGKSLFSNFSRKIKYEQHDANNYLMKVIYLQNILKTAKNRGSNLLCFQRVILDVNQTISLF